MTRCVVFQTKGKLDLRSLTVFGLNAKPATESPIGYFGTGLKYAVAVLKRKNIDFEIWIDGKRWTVGTSDTNFRDKQFKSLHLDRHTMIGKSISLPFTTELGKTWELWQAFRELESNTRDEKGTTFVGSGTPGNDIQVVLGSLPEANRYSKGWTTIIVWGEEFVQEYFNRERTFLPDGLTIRSSNERIQAFSSPSKYVYYRGIRVMDLPEPSQNTYNLLCQIELTEDRTAKEEFWVKHEIEQFLARTKDEAVLERAVRAPRKSLESTLFRYFSSGSVSEALLDHIDKAGDEAAPEYKELYKKERPPEPPKTLESLEWIDKLKMYVDHGNMDDAWEIIDEHRQEVGIALSDYQTKRLREMSVTIERNSNVKTIVVEKDDIPF